MSSIYENLDTNTNTNHETCNDFEYGNQRYNSNENINLYSSSSARLRNILRNHPNNENYPNEVSKEHFQFRNNFKNENNINKYNDCDIKEKKFNYENFQKPNSTQECNSLHVFANYSTAKNIKNLNFKDNLLKFQDFQIYPIRSGMSQIDIDLIVNEFQNKIKNLKQDNEFLEKEIYDKNLQISELERNITIMKQENKSIKDSLKIDELKSKNFSLEKSNLLLNEQLRIYEFSNKSNNEFCFNYNWEEARNKLLIENKALNSYLGKFYSFYNRLITYIDGFKEKFKYDIISKTVLNNKLNKQESVIHDYFLSEMKLNSDKVIPSFLDDYNNDRSYNSYDLEKQLSILENLVIGILEDKILKLKENHLHLNNSHYKNESLFSYNSNFSNETFHTKNLIDEMVKISSECNKDMDYVKKEKEKILNSNNWINDNLENTKNNEKLNSSNNIDATKISKLNVNDESKNNSMSMYSKVKDLSIKDMIKNKLSETKKFLDEKCSDDKYKKSLYLENSKEKPINFTKDTKNYIKSDIYLGYQN